MTTKLLAVAIALLAAAKSALGQIVTVTTVAGGAGTPSGSTPASGHLDGQGTAATFYHPSLISADASGNIYVPDANNNLIRVVSSSFQVTTLAGGNGGTSSGINNAVGTAATFNNPAAVAADTVGNVFVADANNNAIRKIVVSTGAVTTLAGGTQGNGNGVGTNAAFYSPGGVAVDTLGNVFVSDTGTDRIRKIVASSGAVTTLAGSTFGLVDGTGTAAKFGQPGGICADTSGNLYVTDTSTYNIRKIVASSGLVTTIAGGSYFLVYTNPQNTLVSGNADGIGTLATFTNPVGITTDGNGNLFVTDAGTNQIRQIAMSGTGSSTVYTVSTLAGGTNGYQDGIGAAAYFNQPLGVVAYGGFVFVSDANNQVIRKLVITPNCIAAGAQVALANGTSVSIETLTPGAVVDTSKGPTAVLSLYGMRLTPAVVKANVLHFGVGSLGPGLPSTPLTVTAEHGFQNPTTDKWTLFGEVNALASVWPEGLYDSTNGMMVYNVALDTEDERSIIVGGLQLGSWTRSFAKSDRVNMPIVSAA